MLEDVNGEDEHPPGVPANGQRWAYQVVKALMDHPEIWKRSVLFITYDEHGGFYDHVSPPPACEPDNKLPRFTGRYGGGSNALKQTCLDTTGEPICSVPIDNTSPAYLHLLDDSDRQYGGAFNRYGVRVPVMVVSPWAKRHFVSHQTYDHTSILRFIEARFDLPALTRRDANADPLLDFFDFNNREAKLNGTYYETWGKEKLPNRLPKDAKRYISGTTIANPTVPDICKVTGWFKPDPNGKNYGVSTYSAWDWSDGISPPDSYYLGYGRGEDSLRR